MKQNKDIVVIGCLFAVVGLALQGMGFWEAIDLPSPKGFFIQGGLFMLLMLVLNNYIFSPYLLIDQARFDETQGKRVDAQNKQDQALKMMQTYDSAIVNARIKAEQTKHAIAVDAEAQEKRTLEHARQVSDENLKKQILVIQSQGAQVEKNLEKNISEVATEIFNNVFSINNKNGSLKS